MNDFPHAILDEVGHRPWPMPASSWILTQSWHDVLFAHWPVDTKDLRARVPAAFELDLFDTQAWLGILPFDMTNVAPRGLPALPWVSAFPEVNVRTYVRVGRKPGIYFFSLDAGNALAVGAARTMFHLPYFSASIEVAREGGRVRYSSRRTSERASPAEFDARYRPAGPPRTAAPGSLEYFLAERYCAYTVDSAGQPYRLEIHHPPWRLQPGEAEIRTNTMAEAAGIRLPSMAPRLHYAARQDTVAWPLVRVEGD
jgi:uncharacterized protein YqjF (DUF2071 family)